MEPKRAVLYARVSSEQQEKEGYSIPAQEKLLRDYALEKGLKIVHEYVDVETAKKAGRAGFGEMLVFLRNEQKAGNPCRIILVEKTDRLYRNLKDWTTLDELDLEIHLVKEGQVLSKESKSSEKFVHGIKVLMAKNYIDNLGEEVKKGMREKATQGIWPSVAPLGYRNILGPDGKKRIEPDPEAAPIVTRIFEAYAGGGYSLRTITQKAKEWGLTFRRTKRPVNRAWVHVMLKNRLYTGEFEWQGKIYKGIHQPLISFELWERVQHVMGERYVKKSKSGKKVFTFTGVLTCGHCGCALVGDMKKGKYVYYRCSGSRGKCPEKYVREEALQDGFMQLFKNLSFGDNVFKLVADSLHQSQGDQERFHRDAIARLQSEYNTLQKRMETMYLDKLDGRVDQAFFDAKAIEWRAEQQRVKQRIENHQNSNENYMEEGLRLLELAKDVDKHFQKGDSAERRDLLNFVCSNCTWKDGKLYGSFRHPFDAVAVGATSVRRLQEAGAPEKALLEEMLPGQDVSRTLRFRVAR